jgi:catechol 2,3-dioxygenase-like lactoylglutathione lyase family enzyme
LLTIGVADVARARQFYEDLGWRGQEVEQTVFFQAGGQAVVLWARNKLAEDAGIVDEHASDGFGGVALAYNARSPAEVDDILTAARAAGATITKPASTTFYGGYSGYFADPDGHLWEVAHNPSFTIEDDGSLTLPDFSD